MKKTNNSTSNKITKLSDIYHGNLIMQNSILIFCSKMCYDTLFDFNRIAQNNHLDELFWDNQTLFSGNLSYMYVYVQIIVRTHDACTAYLIHTRCRFSWNDEAWSCQSSSATQKTTESNYPMISDYKICFEIT